ncbi:MAG: response regulator transcription factor [Chitinophagaceae bacterium]|nr:MAG: response regulator transcription factor [Chitinophagaceae bacterium]
MVKIIIYDDKEELRESLKLLLSSVEEFEVIGSFDNCETAATDLSEMKPDVVLMDIDMPGMKGIDGVRAIRAKDSLSHIRILMLTVFDDNKNVFESIRAGANGYLLKKTSPIKLIEYIKDVLEGGAPMSASVATQVLKMFSAIPEPQNNSHNLSVREKQVLQSLVDGNSYKMVAADMNLSIDTIRSHIRNIYEKLHVNSKSEAVAKALKNRIV